MKPPVVSLFEDTLNLSMLNISVYTTARVFVQYNSKRETTSALIK